MDKKVILDYYWDAVVSSFSKMILFPMQSLLVCGHKSVRGFAFLAVGAFVSVSGGEGQVQVGELPAPDIDHQRLALSFLISFLRDYFWLFPFETPFGHRVIQEELWRVLGKDGCGGK